MAGLCNWAAAMCSYRAVAKEVEPKIVVLKAAEVDLAAAQREQGVAQAQLEEVQGGLAKAQAAFETAVANKRALEDDAVATAARMDAAASLLAALAGEEARWKAQAAAFGERARCLTGEGWTEDGGRASLPSATPPTDPSSSSLGDCLLAAGFVSYAGPFPREFRERLGAHLASALADGGVLTTPGVTASSFLVDDAEAAGWAAEVRERGRRGGREERARGHLPLPHTHSSSCRACPRTSSPSKTAPSSRARPASPC